MGGISESAELLAISDIHKELKSKYSDERYVLFDVGANVGNYSIALFKEYGNDAEIFSFEPLGSTYNMLIQNVRPVPNIHTQNVGLSDKETTLMIYTNSIGSGLTSVYKRNLDHFGIEMDIKSGCRFTTIDTFCESNHIEHIHFLKIDVEGHELAVLSGAWEMLEKNSIDYTQFEFGGCNIDSRTFFQDFWYLLNEKYDIYKIVPGGLYKISKYTESMEIFIFSNYIAKLKSEVQ